MKKFITKVAVLSALATVASQASVDVSGVALDTTSVETIAGVMLGALAIIWVARKVVSFLR